MSLMCSFIQVRVGAKVLLEQTSVQLLAGQGRAKPGQALLDDKPLAAYAPHALAQRRAVMAQERSVAPDFSAREVVALGRFPDRWVPALDQDGIVSAALALTAVAALHTRSVNILSGGEKARVHLARMVPQLREPLADGAQRWLLLDELTAARGLAHQHPAMQILRDRAAQGTGFVVVLHDLNVALRYADDVVVISPALGTWQGPSRTVLTPAVVDWVWQTRCEFASRHDGVPQFIFSP